MKFRLLTPGPTPVPEETLLELAKPVFFHRTAEFREILAEVLDDLCWPDPPPGRWPLGSRRERDGARVDALPAPASASPRRRRAA